MFTLSITFVFEMSKFDLVLAFDNNKQHYIPGDVVKGTVVRHSMEFEPKGSLSMTFAGYANVKSKSLDRFNNEIILFNETVRWSSTDTAAVKGTQSWQFEFVFPALSAAAHPLSKSACCSAGLDNSFFDHTSRVHLSPTECNGFQTESGDHIEYSIEYRLHAFLNRGMRYRNIEIYERIFLNSALKTPGRVINVTVPQLRKSLAKRLYHNGLQQRSVAVRTCPRIAIHRDSFAVIGDPLGIRFALVDDDQDTGASAAHQTTKVLLRKIRIVVTQRKEVRSMKVGLFHNRKNDDCEASVNKWVIQTAFAKDVILSRQPKDLSTLFGKQFICHKFAATVQSPNIYVRHTISISADVSCHGLDFNLSMEQSLNVVPPPVRRRETSILGNADSPKLPVSNKASIRQDSLAPFPAPGRQFPDLPKCDIPKLLINGCKPPSAVEEPDEDGIIRRDWQNMHDLRKQLDEALPSKDATRKTTPSRIRGSVARRDRQVEMHMEGRTGFGGRWLPEEDRQVNEAVEICRRRSSSII